MSSGTDHNATLSKLAFWLVFTIVAATSLIRNNVFSGTTNVVNWDGYGYYVYLPALFIYGDTDSLAFATDHYANYPISDTEYQLMPTEAGGRFPIYNLGLALLWAPAFLLTDLLVVSSGVAEADGMSYPYQLAVVLMSLLFAWLGLRYLRRWLLSFFPDPVVALTLLGVGLATNLFYYFVESPDLTHGYLFALYAAFLYHFQRWQEEDYRWRGAVVCGLLAGLLCLVRSSEIVVFALPALYGLRNWATLRRNFLRTVSIVAVAALVFSLQLLYYRAATGLWFRDGYAGLGFDWLSPHLYEGFLGYRRGWLVYTPLMVLALAGIARLWFVARLRPWFWPVLGFTLANCYLVFSWHIWWYGDSFGSRPVVQSYALLALPLAAFFQWVSNWARNAGARDVTPPTPPQGGKARWWTQAPGWPLLTMFLLVASLATLNLFQHWQYNRRIIPLDFTNRTYYWEVFGQTYLDKKQRVYLDTNEKLPARDYQSLALPAVDTLVNVPPKARREFTNLLTYRSGEKLSPTPWLRTHCRYSYYGESFDKWRLPSIVTEHRRGGEVLKWVQVKIPPTMDTPALDSLSFAISLPGWQAGDEVKQYVWNLCQDSMVVRTFRSELLY
ncbi:hypothetical protein QWY85_15590 [Neolewinella lacunae]|uniref:Glycosyltransferase RgtA/B/C/D-like domain-containing protein n=1 Tax=Neolewinella lacunae TaxID=1517758 RepID=A0A923PJE4_9BACT|nr:hypothetical protein [Neolewinella lacunae]MBC6992821.1 hypothetical protein [Neolewinella lacunae]MDN3636090.1 hypothetical protein [Neolewinella lacunae]